MYILYRYINVLHNNIIAPQNFFNTKKNNKIGKIKYLLPMLRNISIKSI